MKPENLLKDSSIHEVLARLEGQFGQGAFEIVAHWDGDLCAVGVARPDNLRILAYISTFGLPEGTYYLDLEWPPLPESDLPYQPAGKYKGITFETLANLVGKHLRLGEE